MLRFKMILYLWIVSSCFAFEVGTLEAAETDVLSQVLAKVDQLVCKDPKAIAQYYGKDIILMSDDKRTLLKTRIDDYERMIADYEEMKCDYNRKVLGGSVGEKLGYIITDEIISVKSRLSADERQHSFCNYVFKKEGGAWKISLEQCASLPDYLIRPGEDALYYFHNPIY